MFRGSGGRVWVTNASPGARRYYRVNVSRP